MNRKLAVVVLGLVTVVGAWSLRTGSMPEPGPVAQAAHPRLLSPELSQRPAPKLTPSAPAALPAEAVDPAEIDPGEGPGELELARLQAVIEHEPRDPSWSGEAEATIHAHLRTLAGVDHYAVACSGSLCRIELTLQPEAQVDPTETVKQAVPWPANLFAAIGGAEGEPTAVLFVAREGQGLPPG
jgi:hypothetical protein